MILRIGDGVLGLVNAKGFLGQIVAGGGVGPRPAAEADIAEFTSAALAGQIRGVAQRGKHFRAFPDLDKTLGTQITGFHRQVSAGEHFAFVRNEANPAACQAALGHGRHLAALPGRGAGMTMSVAWRKREWLTRGR